MKWQNKYILPRKGGGSYCFIGKKTDCFRNY